jgi:hypothetical protein
MLQAEALTHAECVDAFIESITEFSEASRVSQVLIAPVRFRRDSAATKASRVAVAKAFQAKKPLLSIKGMVRGMVTRYGGADPKARGPVVVQKGVNALTGNCFVPARRTKLIRPQEERAWSIRTDRAATQAI